MGDEFSREELIPGEWDEDIDLHPEQEYEFISNGYKCKVKRNLCNWTYCGYVYLSETHPDFKTKNVDTLPINVHGELTFGEDGIFGFDCRHMLMGDISPVDKTMQFNNPTMFPNINFLNRKEHYWTFEEVKAETESMAEQFKSRDI